MEAEMTSTTQRTRLKLANLAAVVALIMHPSPEDKHRHAQAHVEGKFFRIRLRPHILSNGMKIVDARHVDIPHKLQHMPAQNMHGVTEHAQRHDAQCACVPCPVSIISRRAPSVNPESQMRTPGSSTPPRPLSHLHRPRGHQRLLPDGFHVPQPQAEVPAKSVGKEEGGLPRRRGKEMER